MKNVKRKIQDKQENCSLCEAKFEVWLNNSGFSEENKERIGQKLLTYCPVCSRFDEK